jgi:hypothetical protein
LDTLILISAIILIAFSQSPFSGLFVYVATIMNFTYIERMEEAIDIMVFNKNTKKQIFALFKLLLANIFLAHFIGTMLVGLTLIETTPNWIDKFKISQSPWWVKYFYSVYWSSSIIVGGAFGDILINNIYEAIVLIFVILFGCLIFSFNVSQVGNIINNIS